MPKKYKLLPPIKPSIAVDAEYRKALLALVKQMQGSVEWYCKAAFKPVEVEQKKLGLMDADPVDRLQKAINEVKRRYLKKFNELSDKLPKEIVEKIAKNVRRRLKNILLDDMTVELKITRSQRILIKALTKENVALIKSIPQQYFKRVEYDIMSTVSEGRDMVALSDKLAKGYDITRNRAIMIAYDQTNKITEALDRANKIELGLYRAIWRHSHASQVPRQSHLAANGKEFDIRKGCYIDGEYIQPAQKVNCNCYSQAIFEK